MPPSIPQSTPPTGLAIHLLYKLMRFAYDRLYGAQQMLHYPVHRHEGESFYQGQANLIDMCLAHLGDLGASRLLDIGCGNGMQTLYVAQSHRPAIVLGVDLNPMHIEMAQAEMARRGLVAAGFAVEDAQSLASLADGSFDAVMCIESSHHYPDKAAFLAQIRRVLRPGGRFVIADLVQRTEREPGAVERRLALFHWHPRRYADAIARAGLVLTGQQDITAPILAAFASSERWLAERVNRGPGARLLGRTLIGLYRRQVERVYAYHLFVGERP